MSKEDPFAGTSKLNLLAAGVMICGIIFPFFSEELGSHLSTVLIWYAFVIIVTLVIASAARTRERLARVEHELGLRPDQKTDEENTSDGTPS